MVHLYDHDIILLVLLSFSPVGAGATAGALLGTVIMPGVGTVIGGLLGALITHLLPESDYSKWCITGYCTKSIIVTIHIKTQLQGYGPEKRVTAAYA